MPDITRLFGHSAGSYASFRPDYPPELFDWLAERAPAHNRALDIGCGNGQASRPLTSRFRQVLACDSSSRQLQEATATDRLHLFVADARALPLASSCFDLITVAQALHWFAGPQFFSEIRRLLSPGGFFCAWCYSLMQVTPAVDARVRQLHGDLLHGYWPEGRASVDNGYRDIEVDFPQVQVPGFAIERRWSFAHLLGYLGTWSAVQRWREERGADPLALIRHRLEQAWGDPEQLQTIRWPLHFVAGYPGH